MKDPIVEEVHRRRERRAARFHHDIDALFEDIRRNEEIARAKGAKFITPSRRKRHGYRDELAQTKGAGLNSESIGWRDPIVEEVRRIREARAAKFGYNIRAMVEDARKREATSGHPIVDLSQEGKKRRTRKAVARPLRNRSMARSRG